MTITNADSYASVAARERYVPRGLANTHAIFIARGRRSLPPAARIVRPSPD